MASSIQKNQPQQNGIANQTDNFSSKYVENAKSISFFSKNFFKAIAKSFFLPVYSTLKLQSELGPNEVSNKQILASKIISVSGLLSYASAAAFGVLAILGKTLPKLVLTHLDKLGPIGFVLYGALALAALLLIIGLCVQAQSVKAAEARKEKLQMRFAREQMRFAREQSLAEIPDSVESFYKEFFNLPKPDSLSSQPRAQTDSAFTNDSNNNHASSSSIPSESTPKPTSVLASQTPSQTQNASQFLSSAPNEDLVSEYDRIDLPDNCSFGLASNLALSPASNGLVQGIEQQAIALGDQPNSNIKPMFTSKTPKKKKNNRLKMMKQVQPSSQTTLPSVSQNPSQPPNDALDQAQLPKTISPLEPVSGSNLLQNQPLSVKAQNPPSAQEKISTTETSSSHVNEIESETLNWASGWSNLQWEEYFRNYNEFS